MTRGAIMLPLQNRMLPPLMLAIVALLGSPADAAQPADAGASGRWQRVCQPDRETLPVVTVTLGEPGPYVPMLNARMEMTAVNGPRPFDGHIGFHFEVGGRQTLDVPVVARATLAPHESWSFTTWVQLRSTYPKAQLNRELVVEWRDRSMRLIESSNAGLPPWSEPRPLRIIGASKKPAPATVLGKEAHVRSAAELPDHAQWFAGFASAAVETEEWLDLPLAVREAMFGSGIRVVFVGSPRAGQAITTIDQALLPVTFEEKSGSYTVPWPYMAEPATFATPVSWSAKQGFDSSGGAGTPYLVSGEHAIFVADAGALRLPLPVLADWPVRRVHWSNPPLPLALWHGAPRPADLFREYRPLLAAAFLLLLCIVLWLMVKRMPRVVTALVAAGVSVIVLAGRESIRPATMYIEERWELSPVGVVSHEKEILQHGETPIEALPLAGESLRTTVTGQGEVFQEAELRTSATAPGLGEMFLSSGSGPWDSTARWTRRREVGRPLTVRILSRDAEKLVFEYESAIPVDFARATWVWNERIYLGAARLGGATDGTATVRAARATWPFITEWDLNTSDVQVAIAHKSRERDSVIIWDQPRKASFTGSGKWAMRGRSHRQLDGTLICAFALARPPGLSAAMTLQVAGVFGLRGAALEGSGGRTTALSPDPKVNGRFTLSPAELQRIAPEGGIIVASITTEGNGTDPPLIFIRVSENGR